MNTKNNIHCGTCIHDKKHCQLSDEKTEACLHSRFSINQKRRGKFNYYYNYYEPKTKHKGEIGAQLTLNIIKTINFGLVKQYNDIVLVVLDEDDKVIPCGYILKISENGKLLLNSDINKSIGLQLDDHGRIEIA